MTSGGQNKIDLKGQKFGSLVVLQEVGKNNRGQLIWKCLCDCGNECEVLSYVLRQKRRRSCGCRDHRRRGAFNPKWSGFEEISGSYWHRLKQGAAQRNLDMEITIQDAWDKFIAQDRKCMLTGLPLVMCTSACENRSDLTLQTASLDRIDSTKGYMVDNIQWTHKLINKLKMDLSNESFVDLCKQVAKHHES
jgi:hypothetical protein